MRRAVLVRVVSLVLASIGGAMCAVSFPDYPEASSTAATTGSGGTGGTDGAGGSGGQCVALTCTACFEQVARMDDCPFSDMCDGASKTYANALVTCLCTQCGGVNDVCYGFCNGLAPPMGPCYSCLAVEITADAGGHCVQQYDDCANDN